MIQIEWKWNNQKWGFEKLGTLVQGLRYQWVLYLGPLHIHKWRLPKLGDDGTLAARPQSGLGD